MNEVTQLKKLMETVDTSYQEVDERLSIAREPEAYDLTLTDDDITVYTHGGEPVFAMSIDDWTALVSKFNRDYRP